MKAKALETFQDGNIFAATIEVGQVIEITQREYELVVQSGGKFQVMPEDTEVTPDAAFVNRETPGVPLTREQFEAKQLKEKQEFDARQLAEKNAFDADNKVEPEAFDLHQTRDGDNEQATRAAEEKVEKKLSERRAKEAQRVADEVAREISVEPEVKKAKKLDSR